MAKAEQPAHRERPVSVSRMPRLEERAEAFQRMTSGKGKPVSYGAGVKK